LLRQCIQRLPQIHREILDLVYYHELSITEAAEVVGVPQNTVKTRLFNARKKMLALLREANALH
jgi:RNA polymerase sigma-70 factor (ECF subfamily)